MRETGSTPSVDSARRCYLKHLLRYKLEAERRRRTIWIRQVKSPPPDYGEEKESPPIEVMPTNMAMKGYNTTARS